MLKSLIIENFLLIDYLKLDFNKGLSVITGESGSGKSIIVNAIFFALGQKIPCQLTEKNCYDTKVSILFSSNESVKDLLENYSIKIDKVLSIQHIYKTTKRHYFFINNQLVSQKIIYEIANILCQTHGQNNYNSLISNGYHKMILDRYTNTVDLKNQVSKCYDELSIITIKLKKSDEMEIYNKIKDLEKIINELTEVNIFPEEEEELKSTKQKLKNQINSITLFKEISDTILNTNLINDLSRICRIIRKNIKDYNILSPILTNLEKCCDIIDETSFLIANIIEKNNFKETNNNMIDERLSLINSKSRKYNVPSRLIESFLQEKKEELENLKTVIRINKELRYTQKNTYQEYCRLAALLSKERVTGAKNLQRLMQEELQHLKLEHTSFNIKISSQSVDSNNNKIIDFNKKITRDGIDDIIFTIKANHNIQEIPINRCASGGEMSRLMLALNMCILNKQLVETIIFDEIDTGIGGETATKIGNRLKKLSNFSQVIVITHLPQVASKANQHIVVNKKYSEKKVQINVRNLNIKEKQLELARMISGNEITKTTLKAAKELLNLSHKK